AACAGVRRTRTPRLYLLGVAPSCAPFSLSIVKCEVYLTFYTTQALPPTQKRARVRVARGVSFVLLAISRAPQHIIRARRRPESFSCSVGLTLVRAASDTEYGVILDTPTR